MNKKPEFHGSDLEKIEEYYHIPKDEIICFSANVNPLGLSAAVRERLCGSLDVITRYPDRSYTELKQVISRYCGADPAHIVVGNGSTELISILISQRAPKKALILGPTYSEYARELSLAGGGMEYYNLKEEQDFTLDVQDFIRSFSEDTELVILCNPNNPTSSAIPAADLETVISECKKRGIFVMVDETYVEFAPDISAVTAVPLVPRYDNLMVIRGVSKFFAAPGLRFGYGITGSQEFLRTLALHQNPWSLSSIADFAGRLMLSDTAYIENTRALISRQREIMFRQINETPGLKAYKPYANFILVRIQKDGVTSFDVFEKAIKERLMIRDCSSFESLAGEYIRFCIMLPEQNEKLLHMLQSV